jgi:holo-[acyl-carrier protein] synthase
MGIELVDVVRFAAALDRYGVRLRERLFSPGECAHAAHRTDGAQSLAVRFAAKLAARKALRASGLAWRDIEVVREPLRPPVLQLHGRAERAARRAGIDHIALTLTHDAQVCIGQVIFESQA